MIRQNEHPKYKEGETVIAKVNPTVKLLIRRYLDRIYYCQLKDTPGRKDLVYFERELDYVSEK